MTNLDTTIDTFLAEFKIGMVAYYQEIREEQKACRELKRGSDEKYFAQEAWYYKHSNRDISLATEYGSDQLEEIIDKDIAARKTRFVNTITKKLGSDITDSRLSIGCDGSVNGMVASGDTAVSVYSVLAGGYNIQKLHYRVLVRLIK